MAKPSRGLLKRTSEHALTAWNQATQKGECITCSFVEDGTTGRMVIITIVPWLDELRFLNTLPEKSYFVFIKPHRQAFYRLSDWEQREFVHWIFLAGKDENGYQDISVSLFYLEAFNSLLKQAMAKMEVM